MNNIIMLPTKDASHLFIQKGGQEGKLHWSEVINEKILDCGDQHLYKVSDEEIKEGDYVFLPIPDQVDKRITKAGCDMKSGTFGARKIIATTDSSLGECQGCKTKKQVSMVYTCSCNTLPQIPEEEIKEFINQYNK